MTIFDKNDNEVNIDRLQTNSDTSSIWSPTLDNELGLLLKTSKGQGKPQDTMDSISYGRVPSNYKVTYAYFIYNFDLLNQSNSTWKWQLEGIS